MGRGGRRRSGYCGRRRRRRREKKGRAGGAVRARTPSGGGIPRPRPAAPRRRADWWEPAGGSRSYWSARAGGRALAGRGEEERRRGFRRRSALIGRRREGRPGGGCGGAERGGGGHVGGSGGRGRESARPGADRKCLGPARKCRVWHEGRLYRDGEPSDPFRSVHEKALSPSSACGAARSHRPPSDPSRPLCGAAPRLSARPSGAAPSPQLSRQFPFPADLSAVLQRLCPQLGSRWPSGRAERSRSPLTPGTPGSFTAAQPRMAPMVPPPCARTEGRAVVARCGCGALKRSRLGSAGRGERRDRIAASPVPTAAIPRVLLAALLCNPAVSGG